MKKEEVLIETLRYLRNSPRTQVESIRGNIKSILQSRGEIGEITTGGQYLRTTRYVDISNEDAMLINEVIYDLISERILTPGIDRNNIEWPWLSVTNMDKLNEKLNELQ